jgi:hypothetical protein
MGAPHREELVAGVHQLLEERADGAHAQAVEHHHELEEAEGPPRLQHDLVLLLGSLQPGHGR